MHLQLSGKVDEAYVFWYCQFKELEIKELSSMHVNRTHISRSLNKT